MNHFSNLMCCADDAVEDAHEMELLKDVNGDALPNLDETIHWKVVDNSVHESPPAPGDHDASDSSFVFDGENPSWLIAEPFVYVTTGGTGENEAAEEEMQDKSEDAHYYDDTGHVSSTSDLTSGDSIYVDSSRNAEREINMMIQSPTDPVGKFLRQRSITAKLAVQLNIHHLLLRAPKTPRQRYGPRQEQSMEEKIQLCKDRNRAHAKATRQRKKLFEQILMILENEGVTIQAAVEDSEDTGSGSGRESRS